MMKKFYIIKRSYESKITDLKNDPTQGEIIRDGYVDKEKFDQFYNYFYTSFKWGPFPPFDLDFQYIKLQKKAKLLDFMTYGPHVSCGEFLISPKVATIFETLKLPPYKLYPAKLVQGTNTILDYKVLYCPWFNYDVIDFRNSIFMDKIPSRINPDVKEIKITNEEEYLKNNIVHVKKIAVNDSSIFDFDLFRLRIYTSYFISERLKNIVIEEGLTGIDIYDPENLIKCNYEI